MIKNLMKWITKKGIPLDTRYSQTKNLTKSKRAKVQIDEKRKKATAIAFGIKQNGLKPTYFIDSAINDAELDKITNALSEKLGKQIMVSIDISFNQ